MEEDGAVFQGISEATIDFLWGIRFNNERGWFQAHKEDYLQHLYRPMGELCREVWTDLDRACPGLGLLSRVSRIYRDARRLFGRGPYKDHLWFVLGRGAEGEGEPCFWFELSPEDYSFGLGCYQAPPAAMAKLRARLDADPRPFARLVRALGRQGRFQLETEPYKRPKGDPGELLYGWYNARTFSMACRRPHDALLFSPQLAEELEAGFRELVPLYRYLLLVWGDPDPRRP